ncbi:MAG: phosphoribosylamine--glycine ligase [Clostridiales bacterium]|jgi:phosphoribosylamine--glycine ligase|nr:phosphoribosylamine--glycine ligase [Clostridiales bacterium]
MRVLIVGSGGREHAIAWKLKRDNPELELFCAPGNGGMSALAQCVPVSANDIPALKAFSGANKIDLAVVGPEEPLVRGIAEEFGGTPVFGPCSKGAMLEGSKSFAKRFMKTHGIPTAEYEAFSDYEEARAYVRRKGAPLVIKADGLAAGKGVTVCLTESEAETALAEALIARRFAEAGRIVVIEELLRGPEASVLAFTDGRSILSMVSAQDHKRANDGDQGPNTGGMGAFSPSPFYTGDIERQCKERIIYPTLEGLKREGVVYKGVIYFGLMLTPDGPKVIEYNCRFGDPETQAVLPRLENNLLDVMLACVNGSLDTVRLKWRREAAVCVAMVSGGYPGGYKKCVRIAGLNNIKENDHLRVFHAGTILKDGALLTDGGRVLGVTALAESVEQAARAAYGAVNEISFDGAGFRSDIGLFPNAGVFDLIEE